MNRSRRKKSDLNENVVEIKRLSKKTKGGNQISFSALVVVGDRKGKVGAALGKAPNVLPAIKKGARLAKKDMIRVPMINGTIPHQVEVSYGAAQVLIKPASQGTGVIAGGPVRVVVEAAGIKNVVSKILGSRSKISNVKATLKALQNLKDPKNKVKKLKHNQSKGKNAQKTKKSKKSKKK